MIDGSGVYDELRIGPSAPAVVAELYERYTDAVTRYRAARRTMAKAPAEVDAAKRADAARVRDAVVAGRPLPPATELQDKANQAAAEARTILNGLASAVNTLGDDLASAILTHRDAWLPILDERVAQAEADYLAAITAAREAIKAHQEHRHGRDWLRDFAVDVREEDGRIAATDTTRLRDVEHVTHFWIPPRPSDPAVERVLSGTAHAKADLDAVLEAALTAFGPPPGKPAPIVEKWTPGRRARGF